MCVQERSYDARAEVRLWGTGDVRFILPAREEEERGGMGLPVVVEEVVASRLAAAVGYAAWLLNHIDPTDRKSTRRTPVTNAHLVCRLLLEKKNTNKRTKSTHYPTTITN